MNETKRPCEFCEDPTGRSVEEIMADIAAALMDGTRTDNRIKICERHGEELEAEAEPATEEDLEEMRLDPKSIDFTETKH